MENNSKNEITNHDKEMRIVIIGAGAAGLTAASALRDKGYQNITILERSDHAGGKCSTVDIDGKNYELGAGMIAKSNTTVLNFVKKYKIPLAQVPFGATVITKEAPRETEKKLTLPHSLKIIHQALWTYRRLQKKYKLKKPGFFNIDHQELSMSFAKFAKKYKIEDLARNFELSHTGFGYGYFADVPAAYVLKYFSLGIMLSSVTRRMYVFPNGIQRLWTRVAEDFSIMYDTNITKIVRKNSQISIEIEGKKDPLVCDKIIITSPLDELAEFLDVNNQEKNLFSQIQYIDYRVLVCELEGFPRKTGYASYNFFSSRAGCPVFWYHRHKDTDITIFYALADFEMSDDQVTNKTSEFVTKMGGKVKRVERVIRWKYFPHVSEERIREGYYDKLESLQGQNNTYYAGELMNFSTVGLTSQYAEYLVNKFF